MTTYHKPLIYDDARYRPIDPDAAEALDPTTLSISQKEANSLSPLSDGIYVGPGLESPTYYVAASGTDAEDQGTRVAPYQTLDYALEQMLAKSSPNTPYFNHNVTLALKAGETFTMSDRFACGGFLVLAFYDDPLYGDYDDASVGTGANPALMTDLERPIIEPQLIASGASIAGIDLVLSGAVELRGVQVDLPISINASTDETDFVVATHSSVAAKCSLYGAIVNRQDTASKYGAFGIQARAVTPNLSQYASQFLLLGAQIEAGDDAADLTCRQWFIKFYPDYVGNNQNAGSLTAGVAGSAVLSLNWSETASLTVALGKTNLASYPTITSVGSGIRNYFYNLVRDAQQRPLNVLTGRLF